MVKRFLATLLTMCMCFSMSTVAFAKETPEVSATDEVLATSDSSEVSPQAGTELWDGAGTVHVGSFTMKGRNLTPIKTTGYSGRMAIITDYNSTVSNTPVILKVEIRDAATQRVLGSSVTNAQQSGQITTYADVNWHQEIQIFFQVYDKNGNYSSTRPCWISYYYSFYAAS